MLFFLSLSLNIWLYGKKRTKLRYECYSIPKENEQTNRKQLAYFHINRVSYPTEHIAHSVYSTLTAGACLCV